MLTLRYEIEKENDKRKKASNVNFPPTLNFKLTHNWQKNIY